tara:strand:- start:193 stop:1026 length:834 start_codon:yes stop_codon:yes gene_type:complete
MAVSSVTEKASTRNFSINDKNERTYTRTFEVITDSQYDGAYLAAAAPGLSIGDTYSTTTESDTLSFVRSVTSECTSPDGKSWRVTADYGPLADSTAQNPLNAELEVEWSFSQFTRATDQDIYGDPILNSAADVFSEAVEIDDSRPILKIVKNEASFNALLAYYYKDAVNAQPFYGGARKTVKVQSISSKRLFDATYGYYWKTSLEFAFNPLGWKKIILDQGYREIVNNKKKNILVQGVPVNEPALLDGYGEQLPVNGQPVFREYEVYRPLPFSVFNV